MKDERKTKEQLIDELAELRQRISELEKSETQHKRAEQELRESEEKYRLISENTSDFIAITGLNREFVYASPSYRRLGYEPDELIGTDSFESVHPDDRKSLLPMLSQVMSGVFKRGADKRVELRLRDKSGKYHYIESTANVIRDQSGRLAILSVFRDITERKRAEEALREGQESYKELANSIADVFFAMDKELRYTYWNKASEDLTGISAKDAMGKSLYELFPDTPQTRRAEKVYLDVLRTQQPQTFVTPYQLGGKDFVFEISTYPSRDGLSVFVKDITERKRAEEALRESEEKYRSLFDSMLNGFAYCKMLYDESNKPIDWIYLDVNDAFENITGLRKDVIGKKVTEAIPGIKEDVPELFETYGKVASTGAEARFEIYLDTLQVWFSVIAYSPMKDHFVTVFEDITERKRAEEALRESEERFRTIVETAPSLLLVCDAEGKNIYVSPNCEEITGYTQEELLGRMVWWVHEDDTPRAKEVYDRTFREGVGCKGLEYKAVKKNGELWYASSSWEPIIDAEGKLKGVVFQTIDITGRKRAEEARRESEERLQAFMESAPDLFSQFDSKLNFIDLNKPGLELLRAAKKEDVIGKHILEISPRLKETGRYDKYAEVIKTGKPFFVEDIVPALPGEPSGRSLSVRAFKVGEGLGIIGTDITERKRAEEALKEYSERLEEMAEERTKELREAQEELIRKERLAILGELAGGVGHELRNPLGVISNAIYYLNTTLPDADETTKEYLEIISSEVRNSEKIVSDLLDLSRTQPAEREEIAVSELVTQVLEKQPLPEKVKVTTKIAPDLPPVFVDPGQIGQVLVNLLTNAYQAMPQGGRLTISAQAEKGKVYLSITDTGCGISKEKMERLFEPLFTTKAKGIGLGLAVSKNLMEVNEGSIEVQSEEGKGSTFTLILPTKEVQA